MKIDVTTLRDGDEAGWDDFLRERNGASLYHAARWRKFYENVIGHDTYYMVAKDETGKIVGVLPLVRLKSLLFGDYMVSVPFFNYGGAVADNETVQMELVIAASELAAEIGVSHIEYRDIQSMEGMDFQRKDKVTMILDLPSTEDELLSSLKAKRRSQIKRPVREGARALNGGLDLLDEFYRIFSINMRDLGTPVYSKRFFRSVLEENPDNSTVSVVRVNNEPAAAAILLRHRDCMEVPWASSLRKFNKISVNMFLYWHLLTTAISSGCKQFDFGRSTIGGNTYKFKKQWGAREKQLYWHYWLKDKQNIPNLTPTSGKYDLAIKIWKKLPLFVANSIGPHLVKNLP